MSHLAAAREGRTRRRPPKLYKIGEVVAYAGVSRQTIHNYTTMGLIRECDWTAGGHRLYDEEVFERLDRIAEMKAAHKTMDDIRNYFIGSGSGQGSADAPGSDA
jgi:DNA-binding transcriptional MerR regulator